MSLPHDVIYEEGTPLYLATKFSPEDAADESGYALNEIEIKDRWFRCRPVTAEEAASEDLLYDLFGDWTEWSDAPPDTVYETCDPGDGHRYLEVQPLTRGADRG